MSLSTIENMIIYTFIQNKKLDGTLNTECDAVFLIVHGLLISERYSCWDDRTSTYATETVPDNWRSAGAMYRICYVKNGLRYTLFGCSEPNLTRIMFESDATHRGHVITVQPQNIVVQMNGSLAEMVPSLDNFCKRLRQELIRPTEKDSCVFPAPNDGRSSSVSPASDLSVEDHRYASNKNRFKKKSTSLYACCLKKNFNNNGSSKS